MSFIATRGLRRVDALNLTADDIELDVLAHSLSQINRFTGHLDAPYSVAQHSVWVANKLELMGANMNLQRAGLLHDGSESFLSDIPSPYKKLLPDYQALETTFQNMVYRAFNVSYLNDFSLLIYCDRLAGLTEARDLHPYDFNLLDWVEAQKWDTVVKLQDKIEPLHWMDAKKKFLDKATALQIKHI
ncbi:MAG: hypothetical protein V3S69_05055 [Dehalococcoidales bacterium]